MLFLGKKRSFLTLSGAISSPLHTMLETDGGIAEARQGLDRDGKGEALAPPSTPGGRFSGDGHTGLLYEIPSFNLDSVDLSKPNR